MSLEFFIDIELEFFIDIKSFRSHYGPGVDLASNGNEYQEHFLGSKGGRCVRLTPLPPSWAVVVKSGNLNFLEPSGPLLACNGTDLPLPLPLITKELFILFSNTRNTESKINCCIFFLVINQIDAQNLFYNKSISCLYMFRAPCAHRQEAKIVLYSLWYHHPYRCTGPLSTCGWDGHL